MKITRTTEGQNKKFTRNFNEESHYKVTTSTTETSEILEVILEK
jgi:hypothetical protein